MRHRLTSGDAQFHLVIKTNQRVPNKYGLRTQLIHYTSISYRITTTKKKKKIFKNGYKKTYCVNPVSLYIWFRGQQATFHPRNDGTLPWCHFSASDWGSKYHDPNFSWHDGLGAKEEWQFQTSQYDTHGLWTPDGHCILHNGPVSLLLYLQVEAELMDKLDSMVSDGKGDDNHRELFSLL